MATKRVTIRDIARRARVSHTTVSRALSGDRRVKGVTRDRILAIADELNYTPPTFGGLGTSKKSRLIGLIVSDISNSFYAELARGMEDKARQNNYGIVFCSMDNNFERLSEYVDLLMRVKVDGIVVACTRLKEPVVEKMIAERFPLVFVNRKLRGEECNYVVLDNVKGAREITEHLINVGGYSRIGIVTGPGNISTGLDRLKGYEQALKAHGIEKDDQYIFQGSFTRETGVEGARYLMTKTQQAPEAIFAGNDYIAMGVFDALHELGLRVPKDVAVVGFDDTDFAANSMVRLTTVSQRTHDMGNLGVQILIDYIERQEVNYVHRVVLEPILVIRDSCGSQIRGADIDNSTDLGLRNSR